MDLQKQAPPPLTKEQILQKVRERLGRFGRQTTSIVMEFAPLESRMRYLLARLGVTMVSGLDAQLAALAHYIGLVGEAQFLSRARHEMWNALRGVPVDTSHGTGARPAQAENPPQRQEDPKPKEPASAQVDPVPKEPEPPRPWIKVPGYEGPERRISTVDRRSGEDRREKLAAVGKNKRFGADRRQQPWAAQIRHRARIRPERFGRGTPRTHPQTRS